MSENLRDERLQNMATRIGDSFLDLLFPPTCHICGVSLTVLRSSDLCSDCLARLPFIKSPFCLRCGRQFEESTDSTDHYCGNCLKSAPTFNTARSLLKYQTPVPELLHRLKYRVDSSVMGAMAEILQPSNTIWKQQRGDLIIPVPLHVKRLRQRGFNQSQILARLAFSGFLEKIAINLLVRVKNTTSQTGLNGVQRRKNLRDAFCVTSPELIEGKSIWLIDDVFTTGTTVSECSKTLKKNGAEQVHVWTFARV